MTNTETILAALADNPGSIAAEVGATPVEMIRLEKAGQVERVGQRQTGKRGRPPVEWAVIGAKYDRGPEPASEGFKLPPGTPRLMEADHIRSYLDADEAHILRFIESTFNGTRVDFGRPVGVRDLEDYRVLAKRYREIVRRAENRVGTRAHQSADLENYDEEDNDQDR